MPLTNVTQFVEDIQDRMSAASQGKEFLTQADVEKRISENNLDFSNCVMKDVDFSRIRGFEDRILSREDGDKTLNFDGSTLENVRLSLNRVMPLDISCKGSKLEGVSFERQSMTLNLSDTEMKDCNFKGSKLSKESSVSNTSFKDCNMQEMSFGPSVSDTSFKGCNMREMAFGYGTINKGTFEKCDMHNADMRGYIKDSNLKDCDLSGANMSNYEDVLMETNEKKTMSTGLNSTKFDNCRLDNVNMSGACLSNTNLDGCQAEYANFRGASFGGGTSLHGATLDHSDFDGATMDNTDLRSSRLKNCKFTNAKLSNMSMVCAKTEGTDFSGTTVTNVDSHEVLGPTPKEPASPDVMAALEGGAASSADDKQAAADGKSDASKDAAVAAPTYDEPSI